MPTVCLDQIKLFTNSLNSTTMKADIVLFMIASHIPCIAKKKNPQKTNLFRTQFLLGGINPSPVDIIFHHDKQDVTILPSP